MLQLVVTRKLRYSFSAHYQCERTYRIFLQDDDEDPGTHLGAKSFLMRAKKEELKSKSALVRYI